MIPPRFFGVQDVWLSIPINDAVVLMLERILLTRDYHTLGVPDKKKMGYAN